MWRGIEALGSQEQNVLPQPLAGIAERTRYIPRPVDSSVVRMRVSASRQSSAGAAADAAASYRFQVLHRLIEAIGEPYQGRHEYHHEQDRQE